MLDLDIDLGFHTTRRDRFRLAAINAPEAKSKGGREDPRFLAARLLSAHTVVAKTLRVDLHGRYVATSSTALKNSPSTTASATAPQERCDEQSSESGR